ncbi:MAG TPA: 2'-deoxycytidine 5'-triphosphate deaminase [Candidatus Paceibacterota bacterium]|nr:2'-deoxycytidine 5'-triphosphate deaminase [Candidatus Paceibacterota bacterium]
MVMPYQHLHDAVFGRVPILRTTTNEYPIGEDQVQPASIDFRLGQRAFAMFSAALPHGETVQELIEKYKRFGFELREENILERGRTYLVQLFEECSLPEGVYIQFSPKSSTGRCDVFVRVLSDKYSHYDRTPRGYQGKLYLEITPMSFDVHVKSGLALVQGRFKTPRTRRLEPEELVHLHTKEGIIFNRSGEPLGHSSLNISHGNVYFHADLDRDIVGFAAKGTIAKVLDMREKDKHRTEEFWEPIRRPADGNLILEPGRFYLLATKERVRIPNICCGELLSFDITTGEFRVHYAGFFDNGFGGESGTNGVLEVRVRDVPFRVVDGQPICAMVFEETFEVPSVLYGKNSHYMKPGPSLSKHFVDRYEAWEKA